MPQSFQLLEPQSGANRLRDFATKPAVMIGGGLIALLLIFGISVSMSGRGTALGAGGPQPSFNTVSVHLQLAPPKPVLMQHLWHQPLTYLLPTIHWGGLGRMPTQRCRACCPVTRSAHDNLTDMCTVWAQGCHQPAALLLCLPQPHKLSIAALPQQCCMCSCVLLSHPHARTPFEVQVKRCRPLPPPTLPHKVCRSSLHAYASSCLRSDH